MCKSISSFRGWWPEALDVTALQDDLIILIPTAYSLHTEECPRRRRHSLWDREFLILVDSRAHIGLAICALKPHGPVSVRLKSHQISETLLLQKVSQVCHELRGRLWNSISLVLVRVACAFVEYPAGGVESCEILGGNCLPVCLDVALIGG